MPDPSEDRPKNLETEDENLKPKEPGPPRSATEPKGASGSVRPAPTATDPDSGEARPPQPKNQPPPGWP